MAFVLINLDFAININQQEASGAKKKTSTKAFIAIGVLSSDNHLFMDNLKSFIGFFFRSVSITTERARAKEFLLLTTGIRQIQRYSSDGGREHYLKSSSTTLYQCTLLRTIAS